MRWSLPIVTIKGTVVRLHVTFLLFLLWLAGAAYTHGGIAEGSSALLFFVLLFVCVTLHEFGHILTARRFGVRTPDVTLLPIGGVARIERIPEKPAQEIAIALAGPAVNLVIAGLLIGALGQPPAAEVLPTKVGPQLVAQLAMANLALALFNLIPAFPMDGGRVLRALLAARFGFLRGTRIAARVGQAVAMAFAAGGMFSGNGILVVIGLFIFIAASGEAGIARGRGATSGLSASDMMITDFKSLFVDATMEEAAEALLRTSQHEFPIVDGQRHVHGMITRSGIVKAIHERGMQAPVADVIEQAPQISSDQRADEIVPLLEAGAKIVAVNDKSARLIGIITWENMQEHLMIVDADRSHPHRRDPRRADDALISVPITAAHYGRGTRPCQCR